MFGTTNLTFQKSNGTFLCPTCGRTEPYIEKSIRRFFTFYFIPLVPLDSVSRFIQCQFCEHKFDLEVLTMDEDTIMKARYERFIEHYRRLMILMMIADGQERPGARKVANDCVRQLGGAAYSEEEMSESLAMAFEADITVAEYAAQIADRVTHKEKRSIVRGVFLVASLDGDMGEMQSEMLQMLPQMLGMDEGEFREVIVEASEEE